MIGRTVSHFKITAKIGEGGMSSSKCMFAAGSTTTRKYPTRLDSSMGSIGDSTLSPTAEPMPVTAAIFFDSLFSVSLQRFCVISRRAIRAV